LKKYQLWHRDTIIIGISANAIETFRALKSENYLGYRILAFVGNTKHKSLHKIPIINKDEITEVCNSDTQVIIALDSQNQNQLNGWLGFFNTLNFKFITIVPDLDGIPIYGTEISLILNYETLLLRLNNNLSNRFNIFLKRMFDITGSLLLLLFLSPLFLFVIIKINSYQPFFKHQRIGKKGQVFECIKFKSMVDNAQELLPELLQDEKLAREWALNQKFKNDPRVTPIGKWLRRTSLDELPQLFNVLKGEMSLVGPRPVTQNELAKYQDNVKYYLQTTPGMTGLWQINGRSDISYQKRVSFDVWYVKNWSLWLDIAILFKTIPVVFRQKGSV
jgi:undecaprenyl-phosphate galactose phosphotransferase